MPSRRAKSRGRRKSVSSEPPGPPPWPVDTWSHYLAELVVNASTETHQGKGKDSLSQKGVVRHSEISSSSFHRTTNTGNKGKESPISSKVEGHHKDSLCPSSDPPKEHSGAPNDDSTLCSDSNGDIPNPLTSPQDQIEFSGCPSPCGGGGKDVRCPPPHSAAQSLLSTSEKAASQFSHQEKQQQQQGVKTKRSMDSVTILEKMEMLEKVIQAQNDALKAASDATRSQRRREERWRCEAVSQYFSKKRENCSTTSTSVVDNAPSASVLHLLLSTSRELWKSILLERLAKYVALKQDTGSSRKTIVSLPFYTELFDVLVEGLNAPKTLSWIENYVLAGQQSYIDPNGCISPSSSDSVKQPSIQGNNAEKEEFPGFDAFGFYSVFKTPIRALAQFDHLLPSIHSLQEYFRDLSSYPIFLFPPSSLLSSSSGKEMPLTPDSFPSGGGWKGRAEKTHSLESFEQQLDWLLRKGDDVNTVAKVLLQGAHPSLRRLFYARALGIPLVVSSGSPRFSESSKLQTNHFPLAGYLPSYLSFGTKRLRDRIRHCLPFGSSPSLSSVPPPSSTSSLSCTHQLRGAVLSPIGVQDTHTFVGDSEKYFVYEEDVGMLVTTLLVDSSSIDNKLQQSLQQLGRPWDSLDSYLIFHDSHNRKNNGKSSMDTDKGKGGRESGGEAKQESSEINEGPGVLSLLPGFEAEKKFSTGIASNSSSKIALAAAGISWSRAETVLHAIFPSSSTLLIAPLCNVTGDTVEQYELLSAMMSQFWKRILGPTPELLQCCVIFEKLTEEFALPAVTKAVRVLQHPPLLLALQWMLTGFAEVLAPGDVLVFWDLLLSYHMREMYQRSPLSSPVNSNNWSHNPSHHWKTSSSPSPIGGFSQRLEDEKSSGISHDLSSPPSVPCALWLLPILAASIFVYRAPLVERSETREQLLQVFSVTHHLSCRLLIQQLLFSGG